MLGYRMMFGLVMLMLAAGAAAQIYQGVDDKGNRLPVFTDRPQVYGGEFVEIEPLETNTVPGEPADAEVAVDDEAAAASDAADAEAQQRAARLQEELDQLQEQLDLAETDLERAEQALVEGQDPTEDDRIGNYGGGARLSDEYFVRVERLQRQREDAQARVDAIDARIRTLNRQQ